MKSKKWLISLGLAVVLVAALALTGCPDTEPKEWLYSPHTGEKVTLTLTSPSAPDVTVSTATMIREQLREFGIDVSLTTMEPAAYNDAAYYPYEGGLELFMGGDHPAYDPISRWIWWYGIDFYEGWWNPTYWYSLEFEELFPYMYWQGDDSLIQVLMDVQEVFHSDLQMYMLNRRDMINAYRTDKWEGWYEQLGGVAVWCNPFSILDVQWVGPEEGDRVLNLGWPTDQPNLNMHISRLMLTEIGCLYSLIMYEPMVTYPRLGEGAEDPYAFKPGLITGYEIIEDERYCDIRDANVDVQVWRLSVREGVKWHDYDTSGKNVTAEDIKWTMENHSSIWEYDKPATWKLYWEGYEAGNISAYERLEWWIEIVDDYTIDFVHDMPVVTDTYPSYMVWEPVAPKHKFEDFVGDPKMHHGDHIGSGAFKFVEQEVGSYIRMERNDEWWGWDENGGPYAGEVEELWFNIYTDMGTWLLALEAGDEDFLQNPSPAALPGLEDDPDIEISVTPGIGLYYLGFNLYAEPEVIEPGVSAKGYRDYYWDDDEEMWWGYGGPYYDPEMNPLHDKVLREAIAYAIDAQAIIDLVNLGYAELANSWVYTDSPAHNDELEWYLFDDVEARSMLEAAGYWWE